MGWIIDQSSSECQKKKGEEKSKVWCAEESIGGTGFPADADLWNMMGGVVKLWEVFECAKPRGYHAAKQKPENGK